MRRAALVFALLAAALPVPAAIPPLSPEQLRSMADAVVVGEILEFAAEEKSRGRGVTDTIFKVRIRVKSVEKTGSGTASLQKGSTITITGSNLERAPGGWTGPTGNHTADYRETLRSVLERSRAKRIEARFYLSVHEKELSLLKPNGLELIAVRDRE